MTCPRCNGLVLLQSCYEHGVYSKMYHCLMCGRYYPVEMQTAQVDGVVGREKPRTWKRVKPEIIPKIKRLLDDGINITEVSRLAGVHRQTVCKMIAKFNWDYRSGRPNRRASNGLELD